MRVAPLPLILSLVLATGCASPAQVADTSTTTRGQGFAPVTTPPPSFAPIDPGERADTTTTTRLTTTSPNTAPGPLVGLVIAPEASNASYDRGMFEHWIDADHNGCDTRCEVLKRDRRTDLPGLRQGWASIYDDYTTDDASELEVDHVVALGEAWRSGADRWDPARRRDFANDLSDPGALRAVTAASNSAKSDHDPANWQPSNRAAWCDWAQGYVRVKVRWALTADEAEAQALRHILADC